MSSTAHLGSLNELRYRPLVAPSALHGDELMQCWLLVLRAFSQGPKVVPKPITSPPPLLGRAAALPVLQYRFTSSAWLTKPSAQFPRFVTAREAIW